ncbi:MAG: response regulator transcription factor [Salinivirgaceae bacterium]|nr:response regulator transcription factor [Salinivirgaceae bacterium]MDD4745928.1 response regulator transcription factor [Salinivirgaceae bacterium]MDY0279736.1 response regulator transcription factor [Salinivirgaceae bacterium]
MTEKKYKVMVVDDHSIFRQGLIMLLSTIDHIRVVGEAENGNILLMKLPILEPDIIFLDIKMPEMDGMVAAAKALKINKNLKIIVMTMFEEKAYFTKMVEIGVSGFLLKTADHFEVERALNRIIDGDSYFSASMLKNNNAFESSRMLADRLTAREIEVLKEICKGFSNHEISDRLCISRRTVDGHRASLLDKTASKNTVGLVIYAIKHGLFNVD